MALDWREHGTYGGYEVVLPHVWLGAFDARITRPVGRPRARSGDSLNRFAEDQQIKWTQVAQGSEEKFVELRICRRTASFLDGI